jgi:uncharacterized protein YkwD
MSFFNGNVLTDPSKGFSIMTKEGPHAYQLAKQYLHNVRASHALVVRSGMEMAAFDHAKDIAKNNLNGHTGSDGSGLEKRLARYGSWMGCVAENVFIGEADPEEILTNFLVDDGVPMRGHRGLVFSPEFYYCGIAQVKGHEGLSFTVITYAKLFTNYSDMKK